MDSKITQFIFDDGEYFAAHTENGGARVGLKGFIALQVPAGHALREEIVSLTPQTVEAFIDRQIEAGVIAIG